MIEEIKDIKHDTPTPHALQAQGQWRTDGNKYIHFLCTFPKYIQQGKIYFWWKTQNPLFLQYLQYKKTKNSQKEAYVGLPEDLKWT